MKKRYGGENIGAGQRVGGGGGKTKYRYEHQRAHHKGTLHGGKLYIRGESESESEEILLDTTLNPGTLADSGWSQEGFVIFVMDPAGQLYEGRHDTGKFHHSNFLGGEAVSAAGEMVVKNGVLRVFSHRSGHCRPGPE